MNRFHFKNTLKFVLILALAFLVSPYTTSCAQTEEEIASVTGEEKAVFAYFKLGKKAPDYEKWIKTLPSYMGAPESKKIQALIKESLRLDAGFANYSLDNDPLVITLDIRAKITSPDENGKSFFISEFSNEFSSIDLENGQIPSFNFPYAEEKVVLVIFELTKLGTMPLTEKQLKSIMDKTDEVDSFFPARLTLHIRPSEADHENAVISDEGVPLWLMSGNIAYMRCSFDDLRTGQDDKHLWDYVAPWYKEIYDEKHAVKIEEYPHPYDALKNLR